MQFLLFFTGSFMGYFSGIFFAGSGTGETGLVGSFLLNFGSWQLHLHHWLISLMILPLFFFLGRKYKLPAFLSITSFGFLLGWMFQGIIHYEDWYQIITKIT